MKVTRCLVVSLILNGLLVLSLGWMLSRAFSTAQSARVVQQLTNLPVRALPTPERSSVSVMEVTAPFAWADLESPDYRVYIDNLRAISCPELIVRDLIVAEIEDLFAGRVRDLVTPVQGRFWELLATPKDLEAVVDQKYEELRELRSEQRELFLALLGTSDPRSDTRAEECVVETQAWQNACLDHVSADRSAAAIDLLARAEAAQSAVAKLGASAAKSEREAYQAALQALKEETSRRLQEILSPEEYQEYQLRTSTGTEARLRLVRMELSEDDLRAVAGIFSRQRQAESSVNRRDASAKTTQAQIQQRAQEELQAYFGGERYQEYRRATDPRFEQIAGVAERLGIPEAQAVTAYAMRLEAETQAASVRENAGLTPEQRGELLAAIRQETQRSLEEIFGSRGLVILQRHGGNWIGALAAPSP